MPVDIQYMYMYMQCQGHCEKPIMYVMSKTCPLVSPTPLLSGIKKMFQVGGLVFSNKPSITMARTPYM